MKIGYIISVVIAFFILRFFLNHLPEVTESISLIKPEFILLSLVFYLLYFYFRAFSWEYILKSLGISLRSKEILFIWFAGESARYIPGGIWSFIGKFYLLKRKKIKSSIIALSLALEVTILMSVTFLFSIPALNESRDRIQLNELSLFLTISVLILIVLFFFSNSKFNVFLKKVNKVPKTILLSLNFLTAFLLQIFAWASFSIGTFFIIQSFIVSPNPILFFSLPIFAWFIGYISFITPMGIGIREGAFILLLGPIIGDVQAGLVAILSRVSLIFTESVNLFIWLLFYQRKAILELGKNVMKKWDLCVLVILTSSYIIIFSYFSILRHQAFASNFDLANMSQTIWNTLDGRPFTLSSGEGTISRFSIHADIILVLLTPLYFFWDRVYTILVAQSIALGIGAIPVYFLSKKILGQIKNIKPFTLKVISLSLAGVYLLNPGLQWTNIYDFHGIAFAIPFLLFAFYFFYTKKWTYYWVFVFLSLTTKEEVSLIVALLGLMFCFIFKERKRGLLTFAIGLSWFFIVMFEVIPYFNSGNSHWGVESLYSPAIEKIVNSKNPAQLFDVFRGYFLISESFTYYNSLLKPFGYLPLLGVIWLIPAFPEFAINLLSTNAQMQTTTLHYDSGIIPFLIISAIFGIRYLFFALSFIKPVLRFTNVFLITGSVMLLVLALRVNYHYSPLPTTPSCWCLMYNVSDEDRKFQKIIEIIPKDASVASSGEVRAHLSRRENSYTLPSGVGKADYVAILNQSRIIGDWRLKEFETSLIRSPKFNKEYRLVKHIGHFYLYKKVEKNSL